MEVLPLGGQGILSSKTDEDGNFSIPDAAEGAYKFKVTKDGLPVPRHLPTEEVILD